MTTTIATKTIDLTSVTPEQIGRCSKFYRLAGGRSTAYWLVLSQSDNETEYEVNFSQERGYTCTCPAGQYGFARCRNFCWHVRAVIALQAEEQQAMAALSQPAPVTPLHSLIINGEQADLATLARVMQAPAKASRGNAKAYQPAAFSLMR